MWTGNKELHGGTLREGVLSGDGGQRGVTTSMPPPHTHTRARARTHTHTHAARTKKVLVVAEQRHYHHRSLSVTLAARCVGSQSHDDRTTALVVAFAATRERASACILVSTLCGQPFTMICIFVRDT